MFVGSRVVSGGIVVDVIVLVLLSFTCEIVVTGEVIRVRRGVGGENGEGG